VEALIRWQHPERGLINPNDFIAIAEETGLIVPVGDWVLENSCRYGRHLRDAGYHDLNLSVNLSARQLVDARLADRIGDILERTGFPASALELEITESMVMHDADRAVTLLDKLRSTGVGVAIDDFGTGYSSLAYLKRFPINCVKIDRSFIRDLPRDRGDGAITRSIIAIAQNMKLNVVAEGVEQEQQLEFLNTYGCQEAQGFLFSAPLPPPALETYLEQVRAA
jgi:EAL domain-containing protein (putative c-di-GMP-specific phosphodiesterase class I)